MVDSRAALDAAASESGRPGLARIPAVYVRPLDMSGEEEVVVVAVAVAVAVAVLLLAHSQTVKSRVSPAAGLPRLPVAANRMAAARHPISVASRYLRSRTRFEMWYVVCT